MSSKKSLSLILSVAALSLFFAGEAFAQNTPGLILTPDKTSVKAGENLAVKVEIETGSGNGTNSYQASLSYPKDKLQFDSINTDGSPFNMGLEAKGGDGKVLIIRGSIKTLEGKLLGGTVNFKALANTSGEVVKVEKDSAIVRSSDNKNILPGSTLQNNKPSVPQGQPMQGKMSEKNDWVNQIFSRIRTFFSSFFK